MTGSSSCQRPSKSRQSCQAIVKVTGSIRKPASRTISLRCHHIRGKQISSRYANQVRSSKLGQSVIYHQSSLTGMSRMDDWDSPAGQDENLVLLIWARGNICVALEKNQISQINQSSNQSLDCIFAFPLCTPHLHSRHSPAMTGQAEYATPLLTAVVANADTPGGYKGGGAAERLSPPPCWFLISCAFAMCGTVSSQQCMCLAAEPQQIQNNRQSSSRNQHERQENVDTGHTQSTC